MQVRNEDKAWSFWRDEAQLAILDPEKWAKVVVIGLCNIIVVVTLVVISEKLGMDELVVRTAGGIILMLVFPTLLAIKMFFKGQRAGKCLKEQLDSSRALLLDEKNSDDALAELDRLMAALAKARDWNQVGKARNSLREFLRSRGAEMAWNEVDQKTGRLQDPKFDQAVNAGPFRKQSIDEAIVVLKEYRTELLGRRKDR